MKSVVAYVLIWLPAIMGGLFPLVVKLDHWLYSQSRIGVRGAIGIEFLHLMLCALSVLVALCVLGRPIPLKQPLAILMILISIALCILLLGVGFESGAALLYAT